MAELDYKFIKKAERITSFDVSTVDFQSLKYKKELQHLIIKHMFIGFDPNSTINDLLFTPHSINKVVTELRFFYVSSADVKPYRNVRRYLLTVTKVVTGCYQLKTI